MEYLISFCLFLFLLFWLDKEGDLIISILKILVIRPISNIKKFITLIRS